MVLPTDMVFTPINPVTPFTYRDTATFLTILSGLESKLDSLIAEINSVSQTDADNLSTGIANLANQLNLEMANLRAELLQWVVGSHNEGVATDPTNGKLAQGLSVVVSRVYDYARIFAYFAKQYDDLGMTAADYDALNYAARHYDLAPLYPTLNDIQGV